MTSCSRVVMFLFEILVVLGSILPHFLFFFIVLANDLTMSFSAIDRVLLFAKQNGFTEELLHELQERKRKK